MNGSIKYWKKQAKMNLSGHWGSAIAGILAVGAVTFIGNILSIQLFPGSTLWPMVAGQVFVFVFSLIAMVFRTGYKYSGKCSSRIWKNCRSCRTYFKQDLRSEETSRHIPSSDHDVYPCGCRRNERTYFCGN